MVTLLELDILCEVKWALGSITMNKASGGEEIPFELFQILKDHAVKVPHSICQQIWKTLHTGLEKLSFHSNPKEGQCQRISNCGTIGLISYASKVMLKILQARLQQCTDQELPGVQAGFRRVRRTRDQIANICCLMEKAREFQKNIHFSFVD